MDKDKDNGFDLLEEYPESTPSSQLTEEEFRELHGERIVFQGCGKCLALRAEKRDLESQLAAKNEEIDSLRLAIKAVQAVHGGPPPTGTAEG